MPLAAQASIRFVEILIPFFSMRMVRSLERAVLKEQSPTCVHPLHEQQVVLLKVRVPYQKKKRLNTS